MLIDELIALKKASELVTVFLDPGTTGLTGMIHTANSRVTALVLYSEDGDYQGWTFFETARISQVEWGNREHQAISCLIDNSFQRVIPLKSASSFSASVVELGRRLECIGLYTFTDEEQFELVKIVDFSSEWLKVVAYGNKSTLSQGYKLMHREEVGRVEVGSPYINKTVQLHQREL